MPLTSWFTEILRNSDPDEVAQQLEKMDRNQKIQTERPAEVRSENSETSIVSAEAVPDGAGLPDKSAAPGGLQ